MVLNKQYIENIIYILVVVLILLFILFLIHLFNIDLNENVPTKLLQVVTMEGMNNNNNSKNNNNNSKNNNSTSTSNCDSSNNSTSNSSNSKNKKNKNGNSTTGNDNSIDIPQEPLLLSLKDFINPDLAANFCSSFQGSSDKLEKQCNKLTTSNCKSSSCCVLLNGTKCVAGGAKGPTFQTDSSGNSINADFYYYQNKCFGNGCPKNAGADLLTQVE